MDHGLSIVQCVRGKLCALPETLSGRSLAQTGTQEEAGCRVFGLWLSPKRELAKPDPPPPDKNKHVLGDVLSNFGAFCFLIAPSFSPMDRVPVTDLAFPRLQVLLAWDWY